MTPKVIFKKAMLVSFRSALLLATLAALVFTTWDWVQNPGGIFRSQGATNWEFVFDTAASWLVPTFAYSFMASFLLYLVFSKVVGRKLP